MVRTPGFHPGNPGSIPGIGSFLLIQAKFNQYYPMKK